MADDEDPETGAASDGPTGNHEPTDAEVATVAAEAAEGVIFSRYARSAVRDVDVTVQFEDGILDVDIYLHAPETDPETDVVIGEAIDAAEAAVDDLFADG